MRAVILAVRTLIFAGLAVFLAVLAGSYARAAVIAEGVGCDPEFAEVMGERAWMEGEREIETAQRILLKPDSILQYSCFVREAASAALAANTIFSDKKESGQLDRYLGYVAMSPAGTGPGGTYLNSNFGHNFAGGFYGSGGPCANMAAVWQFVKCTDFNMDWFKTFEELAASDFRTEPWACNSAARNQAWADAMVAAFPPPATPAAPGGMDMLVHYNQWMFGADCANSRPIPTGITVMNGTTALQDHVCPSPGCYYDGSSGCQP